MIPTNHERLRNRPAAKSLDLDMGSENFILKLKKIKSEYQKAPDSVKSQVPFGMILKKVKTVCVVFKA